MFDMQGKAAIITGSARGFGKEFANRLLNDGAKVCLSDVKEELGLETLKELQRKHGEKNVMFCKCDVSKEDEWQKLWSAAEAEFGYVNLLINNAGINPRLGWKLNVDIMMYGTAFGAYLAMEKMSTSKGGKGGRIINIASYAGLITGLGGPLSYAGYNMAKFANVALTRSFASSKTEAGQFTTDNYEGVKCYSLCPYLARTELVGTDEYIDSVEKLVKKRALTIGEVADAMEESLRLDSNGACYMLYPDVPMLDIPNANVGLIGAYVVLGMALKKMGFEPKVLGPVSLGLATVLVGILLLYVLSGILCCVF